MTKPSGPSGVWQLPQPAGPRTRYSPRSTGVSAAAPPAAQASAPAAIHVLIIRPPWLAGPCRG